MQKNLTQNKFLILTVASLLFLGVTQVSAANDHSSRGQEEAEEHQNVNANSFTTPTPTGTQNPTVTPGVNSGDFGNHGAYVSSVAHEHEGGESVSLAARSSIGVAHGDDEGENEVDDDGGRVIGPRITLTPFPTSSPTATPTVTETVTPTGTVNPTESPTATPSVTGTSTATPSVSPESENGKDSGNGLSGIVKAIQNLLSEVVSSIHLQM